MAQVEYLGKTRDGVRVVVRRDATHYRAYALGATMGEEKEIGSPKIRFSELSAELGLTMDGSRPETPAATPPADEPKQESAPPKPFRAKTKAGVEVEVMFNGTHYIASDAMGKPAGSPKIYLQDLADEIGLVFQGRAGEPGEKDLTETEASYYCLHKKKACRPGSEDCNYIFFETELESCKYRAIWIATEPNPPEIEPGENIPEDLTAADPVIGGPVGPSLEEKERLAADTGAPLFDRDLPANVAGEGQGVPADAVDENMARAMAGDQERK